MFRKLTLLLGILIIGSINAQTLDEILTKADERIKSYKQKYNLIMDVTSTVKNMNNKWEPKEITTIEKTVYIYGDSTHEEIHKATEEKKGKTKDITEDAREEVRKSEEKQRKNKDNKQEEGSMGLTLEELWMYEKERKNYDYTLLSDTLINGRWAHPILTEAHFDIDTLFEGTYYIEKETYDLMMVDMKPSKNPKLVKEMALKFWFAPVTNNVLLLEKSWTKVYASLLIKKFRIVVEEKYSNYQFPNI